jgi:hypothetical protein
MIDRYESTYGVESQRVPSPSALTGAIAVEFVLYSPQREGYDYDYLEINYHVYADMRPERSGIIHVKARRYVRLLAGKGDAELERVKSEVKEFLGSYYLSPGEVLEPDMKLRHT